MLGVQAEFIIKTGNDSFRKSKTCRVYSRPVEASRKREALNIGDCLHMHFEYKTSALFVKLCLYIVGVYSNSKISKPKIV